ncbi:MULTISPECIES: carboxypeptidase regulatory-like domain-containing protein [Haloferax]|uniref:Carboxypeptidase regulatory-like domain-containing protein n=1 Tax=Haloferax marinum TaxID=2666143 RepID=A0A6A8G8K7_9EURY|nr:MULTISPECIES: carboxypeptidase regulatory-like domain-containing protein [Haloferax]KAB1197402.1 carboxypeptidase regulatory-like domain-containing protein [Haloferax sp. CBA1150]MRW96446.1 carboxypeptidase regulatory-like domain-containing protein [Haloferax marinum]
MLDLFRSDTRAIEGLPVRLVVALVVGVASMSVMLNMLSGVQGLATSELDVKPAPDVVETGPQDFEFTVVDHEGNPVEDATVIVKSGTAELDGVVTKKTDGSGTATMSLTPTLSSNREDGTLVVDVKPPAGSSFVDRRENTNVLVVRSNAS